MINNNCMEHPEMKEVNTRKATQLFTKDIEGEYDRFIQERRALELKMLRESGKGRSAPKRMAGPDRSGR